MKENGINEITPNITALVTLNVGLDDGRSLLRFGPADATGCHGGRTGTNVGSDENRRVRRFSTPFIARVWQIPN